MMLVTGGWRCSFQTGKVDKDPTWEMKNMSKKEQNKKLHTSTDGREPLDQL